MQCLIGTPLVCLRMAGCSVKDSNGPNLTQKADECRLQAEEATWFNRTIGLPEADPKNKQVKSVLLDRLQAVALVLHKGDEGIHDSHEAGQRIFIPMKGEHRLACVSNAW